LNPRLLQVTIALWRHHQLAHLFVNLNIPVIQQLFWSSNEQRLRAGWRILLYTGAWLYAPAIAARLIGEWLALPLISAFPHVAGLAPASAVVIIKLLVVIICTVFAAWLLDRRSLRDFGLRFSPSWWLDFGFGLFLGAVLMAWVFAVQWWVGWIEIVDTFHVGLPGIGFGSALLGALLLFVVVGITEEFLARGYHLRNLAEGLHLPALGIGPRAALLLAWLLSSSLFGLLHIFNPNTTWYSIAGLIVAGIFLGLSYVLTGSLAIPIALHITWNFFQGNIFGFPVSGNTFDSATLFQIRQGGPILWTGGAFGPEAGLLGMSAIVLGGLLTVLWVRWRYGRIRLLTSLASYTPPVAHAEAKEIDYHKMEIGD
jgi:membrane protease YdiL (CAAX protease family)